VTFVGTFLRVLGSKSWDASNKNLGFIYSPLLLLAMVETKPWEEKTVDLDEIRFKKTREVRYCGQSRLSKLDTLINRCSVAFRSSLYGKTGRWAVS
jgi:hypothetical protein